MTRNLRDAVKIGEIDTAITVASEPEATTGTDNAKRMTPLRTRQSILANGKEAAFTPSGTGAVTTTVDAKLKQYAPTTDDFPTVQEAVTTGENVQVLAGTYAQGQITANANQVIFGEGPGKTIIDRQAETSGGDQYVFGGADGLILRDLKIQLNPSTPSVFLYDMVFDDGVLDNIEIDGNVTVTGGVRNHNGSVALFTTGFNGWFVRDSKFTNLSYFILKSNATVSTERKIKIIHSVFDAFAQVYLLFNSPATGSLIEDVLVLGNSLGSSLSTTGFAHRGSFAGHVKYGRVIANHAHGTGAELWRAEEAAEANIIALNTAELSGEHGIEIIYNTAGGVGYSPSKFVIAGNILDAIAGSSGAGINAPATSGNNPALVDSLITANIFEGWPKGFNFSRLTHRNLAHHNIIKDATTGLDAADPSLGISENMLTDCVTPIRGAGGLFGRIHIRSAANAIPVAPANLASVYDAPLGVMGWTWEASRFDLVNGSQNIDILPLGYLLEGTITLMYVQTSTAHRLARGTISWNGTTLAYTSLMTRGTGVVTFGSPPFVNNSGKLAIDITNGGGTLAGSRLFLDFAGVHVQA
jgi:hypothetical protein